MKSYYDFQPQERATLTEEQVEEMVEIQMMIDGVVKPTPPRLRKRLEDVPVPKKSVYRVVHGTGSHALNIAFATEEEARAFLAMKPLAIHSDWETRTDYFEPLDRPGVKLEMIATEEAITTYKADLKEVAAQKTSAEDESRKYNEKMKAVQRVRDRVFGDWQDQIDKFGELCNVKMAYADFLRLAKGDADMALACLRKAFGEDVVLEAATWLELPELKRALPTAVQTEIYAAAKPETKAADDEVLF